MEDSYSESIVKMEYSDPDDISKLENQHDPDYIPKMEYPDSDRIAKIKITPHKVWGVYLTYCPLPQAGGEGEY